MKIAYNACYGGFALSRAAVLRGRELSGDPAWNGASIKGDIYDGGIELSMDYGSTNIPRTDHILIQVIEELGPAANGSSADLKIADVPAGQRYRIDEYDGSERVMTIDDYEWEVAT